MAAEHRDNPDTAVESAERLIGGIITFSGAGGYRQAAEIIESPDMPTEETALIWQALGELVNAGAGLDALAVAQHARRIGGHVSVDSQRLQDIAENVAFGTVRDVDHHARTVARFARRRRLIAAAERLLQAAQSSPVDMAEAMGDGLIAGAFIRGLVGDIDAELEPPEARSAVRLSEACRAFVDSSRKPAEPYPWPGDALPVLRQDGLIGAENLEAGPATAWIELAKIAHIGPETVAVLTGPTGRGKTAFALQVAAAVAAAGHRVLYASAELGADELVARLVAQQARAGAIPWRSILAAEKDDVKSAVENLAASPVGKSLHLWTPMGRERNATELERMARQIGAQLVVVDYLQRFVEDGPDKRAGVGTMSGALRDLSRPRQGWPGAAVLALSSVARTKYEPFASCDALRGADADNLVGSGKECGELEYDATLVFCLTTDRTGDKRDAVLRVVKQRAGVDDAAVGFTFNAPAGRFEPATPKDASSTTSKPKPAPAGPRSGRKPEPDYD